MTARVVAHISPEGVVRGSAATDRRLLALMRDRRGEHLAQNAGSVKSSREPQWTRITAELWEPDPAA